MDLRHFFSLAHRLQYRFQHQMEGNHIMFDRSFFASKLGQASLASVAAMCAFVALSTQMHVAPAYAATLHGETVEIA